MRRCMQTDSAFSVLIPVYFKDSPDHFRQALKSILNQTVSPNEIVVVKDGPLTQQLEEVIDSLKDERFKIVSLKENVGLGNALREGVLQCSHDIIARMDADDIAVNNRFEVQINEFYNNPLLDLLGGQIIEFEKDIADGKLMRNVPCTQEGILNFAKTRNPFNHMTVMFKKIAVLSAGNYMNAKDAEDYFLWVRMLQKDARVKNLNKVLVFARTNGSLVERRHGLQYAKNIAYVQKLIYKTGFISLLRFLMNTFLRFCIAILPSFITRSIYNTSLRKHRG